MHHFLLHVLVCFDLSRRVFWPQYMYPKLSPNSGYHWCPLGKIYHLGMEQLWVWIARSAALVWWRYEGMSWNLTLESRRNVLRPPGNSLSIICYWGVMPQSERKAWRTRVARMSSCSLQEVSGFAKMELLSWSYKTTRYFIPREEVTGKRPVWSVLPFPVKSIVCRYAIWVRTLGS